VQECVSEFICWITADASDKCQDEKRKTINGEDIICSMDTLGFDEYIEPLKVYLAKYRASVKGEKHADMDAIGGSAGDDGDDDQPPSQHMPVSYHGGGGGGGYSGGSSGYGGGGGRSGYD
ncbi:unnamed protein product, partial [Hapterophycus canaliculatus]